MAEYLDTIPPEDRIIILTSRTEQFWQMTLDFLAEARVRYDQILFCMPMGERILVNDQKPSGVDMAVAVNVKRAQFLLPGIVGKR